MPIKSRTVKILVLINAYPEQIALVARDKTVCRSGSGQRQQIIVERIAGNRDDLKVRDNDRDARNSLIRRRTTAVATRGRIFG
jgi:pyrrolidone-carboxylate peptidase